MFFNYLNPRKKVNFDTFFLKEHDNFICCTVYPHISPAVAAPSPRHPSPYLIPGAAHWGVNNQDSAGHEPGCALAPPASSPMYVSHVRPDKGAWGAENLTDVCAPRLDTRAWAYGEAAVSCASASATSPMFVPHGRTRAPGSAEKPRPPMPAASARQPRP